MIVADVKVSRQDGAIELAAMLHFEEPAGERTRIFFRWPEAYGCPEATGDPFLAGLVVPAMACGERLHIDAPVSADLMSALRSARRKPSSTCACAWTTPPPSSTAITASSACAH
jgi:hypothetical protein